MNKNKLNGVDANHNVASCPDSSTAPPEPEHGMSLEDKRREFRRARSHSRRILQRGLSVSSQSGRLDSTGSAFGADNQEVNYCLLFGDSSENKGCYVTKKGFRRFELMFATTRSIY